VYVRGGGGLMVSTNAVCARQNTLQHTVTHCNTLQHTATHCNALQHAATRCNTLQHTATHECGVCASVCTRVHECVSVFVRPSADEWERACV